MSTTIPDSADIATHPNIVASAPETFNVQIVPAPDTDHEPTQVDQATNVEGNQKRDSRKTSIKLAIPSVQQGSSPRGSDDRQGRRGSSQSQRFTLTLWKPRDYHHWKSPLLMILFSIIGFGLSVGHCVFYYGLNGKIVGDSYKQEEKLR